MTARNTKTSKAWEALQESNKSYNRLIKKTQQQAWRKFCQETEFVKESAMNKIIKVKLEAVYNRSGQLTSNAEETLVVMAQTHFKDCTHDLRAPHNTIVTPADNLTSYFRY
jgi:hypothetical protein